MALNLEKKINCLILEAGKEEVSYDSQDFYKGEVIGLWPKDLTALRLRQFGGTTGHWGELQNVRLMILINGLLKKLI